jgi:hypothetical protein
VSLLPGTQFAFNTRTPDTGFSPAMLLFGFNPRSPIENLVDPPANSEEVEIDPETRSTLQATRLATLDARRIEATDNALKIWEQRVIAYDRKLRRHKYQVGDLVLFQKTALHDTFGRPWDDRWRGPAQIIHITRKGKLDLQHPSGDVIRGWHTDKVRPYVLRSPDWEQ